MHYLMIVVTVGKTDFERVYWPLASPDEEPRAALGRWIESQVEGSGRTRNLDKLRDQIRAKVEHYKVCHPSSWYREQAEIEGRPYPSPPGGWRRGTRRRRVAVA